MIGYSTKLDWHGGPDLLGCLKIERPTNNTGPTRI